MVSRTKFAVIAVLPFLFATADSVQLTAKEYNQLPRLFHLDDYFRCLSESDGVYCLGKFQLTPLQELHHLYKLMQIHTENRYNFNRTYIHRGYCLNTRCPSSERNHTLHFEKCANSYAEKHGLRAKLSELQYCRTYDEANKEVPQTPQQALYIQIVCAILVLNVIGTVYDVASRDKPYKNKLLTAWSIPTNWKMLIYVSEESDPRFGSLVPLHGVRVILLGLIAYIHARLFHYSMYVYNPDALEKLSADTEGVFLTNGTLIVHWFAIMTSFVTSYQLLIQSQKQQLHLIMLPICTAKRAIRILPVHMLLVGYASTWWAAARGGPLVSAGLGQYSRACREKLWTHIFFLNNVIDKENNCLGPTWYLPVDMHLFIVACGLTLITWRNRQKALPVYLVCYVLSLVVNSVICYIYEWKPISLLRTSENIRTIFDGVESYSHFYISTWGVLPACFCGLFMGHLHFELQQKGLKGNYHKWIAVMKYAALPLLFLWNIISAKYAKQETSMLFVAPYIAVDRFIVYGLIFFFLFGIVNDDGPLYKFLSWSKWQVLTRLSLSVMLIHWIVNLVIATRPTVYGTSVLDAVVDWLATTVITYCLAVPVTVLVEIPMKRLYNAVIFYTYQM